MANKKKLPKLEEVLDRGQCDFGEELFPPPSQATRLDVMNSAFKDLTAAVTELSDLADLVKFGGPTVRPPEVSAAQFGNLADLMSAGSEELTLLAQRIRQLTTSIHTNLF